MRRQHLWYNLLVDTLASWITLVKLRGIFPNIRLPGELIRDIIDYALNIVSLIYLCFKRCTSIHLHVIVKLGFYTKGN
jgi:hypothetical protein